MEPQPEKWVDLYGDILFHYTLTHLPTPNLDIAEELVQETFVAALRSDFSGKSSEKNWLIAILRNKIIDYYRREKKRFSIAEKDNFEGSLFNFFGRWKNKCAPKKWKDPYLELEKDEFWQVVEQCFAKLPKSLAMTFKMRYIDDVDGEEICQALDITKNNFWTSLHRARVRLRECLEINWFRRQK